MLVTPFSQSGATVDLEALEQLVARCEQEGVQTLTALGNTAEVYQLTGAEQRATLRAVADRRERAALVAGLSGGFADQLELAEEAALLGYDAVMLHEPLDPLACEDGVLELLLTFVDRSPLPVVAYVRTDRLGSQSVVALARHSKVAAIKYAVPSVTAATAVLEHDGARESCIWICGLAESMVPTFALLGMQGFTSGLANVRPDLALGVLEAVRQRDWPLLADRIRLVQPFELLRNRDRSRHNVAVVKEALFWHGIGAPTVRPPCSSLDEQARRELHALLRSWPLVEEEITVLSEREAVG